MSHLEFIYFFFRLSELVGGHLLTHFHNIKSNEEHFFIIIIHKLIKIRFILNVNNDFFIEYNKLSVIFFLIFNMYKNHVSPILQ